MSLESDKLSTSQTASTGWTTAAAQDIYRPRHTSAEPDNITVANNYEIDGRVYPVTVLPEGTATNFLDSGGQWYFKYGNEPDKKREPKTVPIFPGNYGG